jgi:hypothetical protein
MIMLGSVVFVGDVSKYRGGDTFGDDLLIRYTSNVVCDIARLPHTDSTS